jgi:hypothetical protein
VAITREEQQLMGLGSRVSAAQGNCFAKLALQHLGASE